MKRIVLSLLFALLLAHPAQAAITIFDQAHRPTSTPSTGDCSGTDENPNVVAPPANMQNGDYVFIIALMAGSHGFTINLAMSETGGQSWTSEDQVAKSHGVGSSEIHVRLFHTRFNGTWSADPSVACSSNSTDAMISEMIVSRGVDPTTAMDVSPVCAAFDGSGSNFDVTIPEITTTTNNAMVLAWWTNVSANASWTLQTPGWSQLQSGWHNTTGNDVSVSHAYKIQGTAGGTGSVTNQEAAGRDGVTCILALKAAATFVPVQPIFFP